MTADDPVRGRIVVVGRVHTVLGRRPSGARIHHVRETLRPQDGEPLDPRRAG